MESDTSAKNNVQTLAIPLVGGTGPAEGRLQDELVQIWSKTLGAGGVTLHSDFLELGGDSLLAAQLAVAMAQAFPDTGSEENLLIRALFEDRTPERIAARLSASCPDSHNETPPSPANGALRYGAERSWHPLTTPERELWAQAKDIERAHQCIALMTYSPVALPLLQSAVRGLFGRYPELRRSFALVDGRPMRRVRSLSELEPQLEVHYQDLSPLPWYEWSREIPRFASEFCRRPFDLERDPLLRIALFRLDVQAQCIVLCGHRLLVDDWSVGILFREATRLLNDRGQLSAANPGPDVHAPAASAAESGTARRVDLPRPDDVPCAPLATALRFWLPPELRATAAQLCRTEGVTLHALFLANFQICLFHWKHGGTAPVAVTLNLRHPPNCRSEIGQHTVERCIYPEMEDGPTFLTLARRVLQSLRGLTNWPDLWRPDSDVATTEPEFPSADAPFRFRFHPHYSPARHPAAAAVDSGVSPPGVTLSIVDLLGSLDACVYYRPLEVGHGDMLEFIARFQATLERALADPDLVVTELGNAWQPGDPLPLRLLQRGEHVARWMRPPAPVPAPRAAQALAAQDGGTVSIITAAYVRNARRIERLLQMLRLQQYAGEIEMILCDDGSPNPERLESVCRHYGAQYVRSDRRTDQPNAMQKSRALNRGIDVARGQYLLFLDQDIYLAPHHVQNCVNLLEHHGKTAGCYGDRVELVDLLRWEKYPTANTRFHFNVPRVLELLKQVKSVEPVPSENLGVEWPRVLGNSLFLSRETVDAVGPFDEEYVGYGEEDMDYIYRLYCLGTRFIYMSGLQTYHVGHPRQELHGSTLFLNNLKRFFTKFPETAEARALYYQLSKATPAGS